MPTRQIKVETRICKNCRKEMADRFALELGVESASTIDLCWDCNAKRQCRARASRAAMLRGAVVERVITDGLHGDLDGLFLRKGQKLYEVFVSGSDLHFDEKTSEES